MLKVAAGMACNVGPGVIYLAAQSAYHLLSNCTYQPDIGSLSKYAWLISGLTKSIVSTLGHQVVCNGSCRTYIINHTGPLGARICTLRLFVMDLSDDSLHKIMATTSPSKSLLQSGSRILSKLALLLLNISYRLTKTFVGVLVERPNIE